MALTDIDRIIGLNIKAGREKAGLSQEELGAAMSPPITGQQVSKYELGTNRVSAPLLLNISKQIGVAVQELMEAIHIPAETDIGAQNLLRSYKSIKDRDTQAAIRNLVAALVLNVQETFPSKRGRR